MATRNPRIHIVKNGQLFTHAGRLVCAVPTGNQQRTGFYDWLESHRSFAFSGASGYMTAVKERRQGGADNDLWYWFGHRRIGGRLRRAYLGKSQGLTLARLERAAGRLAQLAFDLGDVEPDSGAESDPPAAGRQGGEAEQMTLDL